ncbi:MAG: GTPase [Candidatus Micrarchaeota archaeon]
MVMESLRDRGRMNKWAALEDMVHGADVVIEVLDARDVAGTRLPVAERMAGSNRLILIANKADLLPPGTARPALPHSGMYISAKDPDPKQRRAVIDAILARTRKRPIKALLVGYPNVGKSTLINLLAKRKAAKVSAVAGTTKNIQWVNVTNTIMVSDYRGLFPEREHKDELARKGAINVQGDELYHAHRFIEEALRSETLRKWLGERFDVDLAGAQDSEEVLRRIALRRGWVLKGGEPNLGEAARSVVRAMLEAPEM